MLRSQACPDDARTRQRTVLATPNMDRLSTNPTDPILHRSHCLAGTAMSISSPTDTPSSAIAKASGLSPHDSCGTPTTQTPDRGMRGNAVHTGSARIHPLSCTRPATRPVTDSRTRERGSDRAHRPEARATHPTRQQPDQRQRNPCRLPVKRASLQNKPAARHPTVCSTAWNE